jgi:(p)ppGpp synthase/HD superfamily hydrolase
MIQTALDIVTTAFAGHTDRAGKPYLGHLVRVQKTVAENGGDEIAQTAALLHDLLEDTPYPIADLRAKFPPSVIEVVELLTKQEGGDYDDYLSKICDNANAVRVKLADLKDNMDLTRLAVLTEKDIERVKKYHRAYIRLTDRLNRF